MADINVYGIYPSTCTRRVLTVLEEIGQAYKFHPIDFQKAEHKTPEYLAKHQPFGRIPSLYDGDFHVFESRAISAYLANAYDKKGTLYPSDPKKRAIVDQWISVEQNYYDAAEKIVGELVFKQYRKLEPDHAVVEAEEKRLHEVLAVLNHRLGQSKFLGGDHFTIADIFYLPYTDRLVGIPRFNNVFDKYPNVANWWKTISSLPSWQKVISLK